MSTLTDRYVHAATRFVQDAGERDELALELRERIEDTIEALAADGRDPADAERQALTDLGDPLLVSAQYRQKPTHLIGPQYFYSYLRLLVLVICTAAPVVGIVMALVNLSDGGDAGEIIGGGIGAAFSVAIQIAFWITLGFAVVERVAPRFADAWNPDMLPETPTGSSRRTDLVATVVALALTAVALVWQHVGSPIIGDGGRIPILSPDLWNPWLALVLVLLVAEAAHAVWLYRQGWTRATAVASAVIALAFAAVVVPLLVQHRVLNPAMLAQLAWTGKTDVGDLVVAGIVILITVWEIGAGFVRASRRQRTRPA